MKTRGRLAAALFALVAAGCSGDGGGNPIAAPEGGARLFLTGRAFDVGAETREWYGIPLKEYDAFYAGGEAIVLTEDANNNRTEVGSETWGWDTYYEATSPNRTVIAAATLMSGCNFRHWETDGGLLYDSSFYLDEHPDKSSFYAIFDCYP